MEHRDDFNDGDGDGDGDHLQDGSRNNWRI